VIQIQPGHRASPSGSGTSSRRSTDTERLCHESSLEWFYGSQVEGGRAGGIEEMVAEDTEVLVQHCHISGGLRLVNDDGGNSV
jgi:hypothetical protein